MLEELVIKDYALIDQLSVDFIKGLTILTGETGAGKSIIVGALSFVLGGKSDMEVIRSGCDEASVSAWIRMDAANTDAFSWLAEREIAYDDYRILIRRNIKSNGRGNSSIQGTIVTRNELVEFTSFLFDMHGQHEHQLLLKTESHRKYLDRFAGIETEVQSFTDLFSRLSEQRKLLESLKIAEKGKDERLDFLHFSMEEIDSAGIVLGEINALETEARKLADHEKLALLVASAASLMFEDEFSAVTLLRKVKAQLDSASLVDPSLLTHAARVSDLFYETEDAANQVRLYRDELVYDPERLEKIEERLNQLYKLKKKYGTDEAAILLYRENAQKEYGDLLKAEESCEALELEIAGKERELAIKAAALSSRRTGAAKMLGAKISEILLTLGMPKAQFSVNVKQKADGNGSRICGPHGMDSIEFMIAPNMGEPHRELARIVSGGELSRIMLAIKTILAKADTVETLVFDEIDTGIGGEVALSVGRHLEELGKVKQIFCITHLASIAIRADNHLKVEKLIADERTTTKVALLTNESRREEIARMLAGDSAGEAALAHADELLGKYGRQGQGR